MNTGVRSTTPEPIRLDLEDAALNGDLSLPAGGSGVVVFAHGSGSSRHSPRNRAVARTLQQAGFGTLLLDLLTESEERRDVVTAQFRFDIHLLARRVTAAIDWASAAERTSALPLGLFGASTGAAAALMCAAERPSVVRAVVSRGGRPDLAGDALTAVAAPTLLIVGGQDDAVIQLNREAFDRLSSPRALEIVAGATHLFEEPGALEQVAALASGWFGAHLSADAAR